MGRADDLRAQHEAEIAVVELEDELLAAKGGSDDEALRDVKLRLREARERYRNLRSGDVGEGDAVASPAAIKANASVRKSGGDA